MEKIESEVLIAKYPPNNASPKVEDPLYYDYLSNTLYRIKEIKGNGMGGVMVYLVDTAENSDKMDVGGFRETHILFKNVKLIPEEKREKIKSAFLSIFPGKDIGFWDKHYCIKRNLLRRS